MEASCSLQYRPRKLGCGAKGQTKTVKQPALERDLRRCRYFNKIGCLLAHRSKWIARHLSVECRVIVLRKDARVFQLVQCDSFLTRLDSGLVRVLLKSR